MTSTRIMDNWTNKGLRAFWIVVLLVGLGWIGLARFGSDEIGNSHVVTVRQQPTITVQPEAELPDVDDDRGLPDTEQDSESELTDGDTGNDPAPTSTQPPPSRSALGIDNIVREFVLSLWGGETLQRESDYVVSTYTKLDSNDPMIRLRGEFELAVSVELIHVVFDNIHYQQLDKMESDNWEECLAGYGLPPLSEFSLLSEAQQEASYEELGLVGNRMTQFELTCWSRSRIYAGKDAETDRLLGLLHQDLLKVAQDWIENNLDKAVLLPE